MQTHIVCIYILHTLAKNKTQMDGLDQGQWSVVVYLSVLSLNAVTQ